MEPINSPPVSGLQGVEQASLKEAMQVLDNWTPTSDVFALKYYMVTTGLVSSGTASYLNSHYRKVVKLRNQAFMTTVIPVVILPSIVGSLLHHAFVQTPLILQKYKCSVCLEMRGGMVQLFSGLVYPMVLAPFAAFQYAVRLYTYPLPDITKPKLWFKEFHKLTKPILPKIYLLAVLQIIVGTAWTHWEAHNLLTVMSKLAYMEEAVEKHRQDTNTLTPSEKWL